MVLHGGWLSPRDSLTEICIAPPRGLGCHLILGWRFEVLGECWGSSDCLIVGGPKALIHAFETFP